LLWPKPWSATATATLKVINNNNNNSNMHYFGNYLDSPSLGRLQTTLLRLFGSNFERVIIPAAYTVINKQQQQQHGGDHRPHTKPETAVNNICLAILIYTRLCTQHQATVPGVCTALITTMLCTWFSGPHYI